MSQHYDPSDFLTTNSLFTLFYFTFCTFFVFPTREFVSLGVTIECLFDKILKSELENFVLYHVRRTSLTLFVHSTLPLGELIHTTFISLRRSTYQPIFLSELICFLVGYFLLFTCLITVS